MAAEGAGSLPGDHRHTRGWPLRGQGRGCRGSPRANEGEYADAASRTLAKAPSCSCSSKFQPAVAFFGATQPAPPGSRGWSLPSPSSCPALRDAVSLSKLAGGSLAKAANPAWPPCRQRDGGAGPEPGQSPGVAAAAGSRQGGGGSGCSLPRGTASHFSVPAAAAAPRPWLLLLGVGAAAACLCHSQRLRPRSLAAAAENNFFSLGELGPGQHQGKPQTTRTGLAWFEMKPKESYWSWFGCHLPLLRKHIVARPMMFPSHLQLDRFSFYADCEEPLCPVVPL